MEPRSDDQIGGDLRAVGEPHPLHAALIGWADERVDTHADPQVHAVAAVQPSLAVRYAAVRSATERLVQPLSAEDCALQSMPDASPAKWHLAHTTWFFETLILERFVPDHRPFQPAFRALFNSYYNAIGDKQPRPERGLI